MSANRGSAMPGASPDRLRGWLGLILLWGPMLYASVAYARRIAGGGDYFQSADWLISYAGGFVRRGLFGQLYLLAAPPGAPGLWLLFAVQVLAYAVVGWWLWLFLVARRFTWESIAVACGPAVLAFAAWDLPGGFRKEQLLFVALVLWAWARRSLSRRRRWVMLLAGSAVWVLAVFSWEAAALLVPAAWWLLCPQPGSDDAAALRRLRWAVVAASVAAVALAVGFPGGPDHRRAVCAAVRLKGLQTPGLCDGAIAALGWPASRGPSMVAESFPLYLAFVPFLILAVLPVVRAWPRKGRRWLTVLILGALPLFVVAVDYGRWIHVLVTVAVICLTAGSPNPEGSPPADSTWTPYLTLAYALGWGLPHFVAATTSLADWPVRGAIVTLVRLLSRA